MSIKPNKLLQLVTKINHAEAIPKIVRNAALTFSFNSFIRYAGTTGIGVQQWDEEKTIVNLKNRFHIQNHLKGVHATAMATLAESTTGMLFGLYVPDTHLPLYRIESLVPQSTLFRKVPKLSESIEVARTL